MIWFWAFTVCSLNVPGYCRQVMPSVEPVPSPIACFVTAQETAAAWLRANPGWRFDRVRCTPGSPPPEESHA